MNSTGEIGICLVCKSQFNKTRLSHVYCSNKCAQRAYRNKNGFEVDVYKVKRQEAIRNEINKLKALYLEPEEERYCPLTCKHYSTCRKRQGEEYEHVSSGSGRWRSIRGCSKE